MNWGKGIVIVFIAFAAMILTLVFKTMKEKTELVSDNYYADELAFQQQIEQSKAAAQLSRLPEITTTQNLVSISFPNEMKGKSMQGEIVFFRPSDASKDHTYEIAADTAAVQRIQTNELTTGLYEVSINWQTATGHYFSQHQIYIPR
jgi:hypothetical protein